MRCSLERANVSEASSGKAGAAHYSASSYWKRTAKETLRSPILLVQSVRHAVSIALGIIIVLAFFFFAPILFFVSIGGWPAGTSTDTPIYRSLGCATIGLGVLYAPSWSYYHLGCTYTGPSPS